MHPDRLAVFSAAGLLVLVGVATGPQLALISIPEGGLGAGPDPGSGSADLEVISAPERAAFEADEYGDVHFLNVPDTTVAVSNVTGAPLLTLSLEIPALGFQRSSLFTVDGSRHTGTYGIERVAVDSGRLDQDVYDGIFRMVLRDDDGRTVVYEHRITVEVEG